MNQKLNFTIIISCVLLYSLVLSSCAGSPSLAPSLVPASSPTPLPARTDVPSATPAVTATPTMNNKTIIVTPDDLFSWPGLKALNTPDSENFCEHLPSPQIVANPDRFSVLSGRFVLCPWESWPWVINTAMDLDTGRFVSKDDERADIVMQNGHATIDGTFPPFSVKSLNTAQIDGVTVDALNYEYCEQDLLSLSKNKIQSVLIVRDSSIACIKTTEDKITLIRVEKIYPPNILSVEFSFAVLRNE
jgi:hypothetical protein